MNLTLWIQMLRCYVFAITLYGCDAWMFVPSLEKKPFEICTYRRILQVPRIRLVANAEFLIRMRKETDLSVNIKEKKKTIFR